MDTLDGQPFLAINGLQTLSQRYVNLLAEIPNLQSMGIQDFRLSPHCADMIKITNLFRARAAGWIGAGDASARLQQLVPAAEFSNGFFHQQAGLAQVAHGCAV